MGVLPSVNPGAGAWGRGGLGEGCGSRWKQQRWGDEAVGWWDDSVTGGGGDRVMG